MKNISKKMVIGLVLATLITTGFSSVGSRIITDSSDTISTMITNSKGNSWTATGANLQLAIWDLNGTGGTVWMPVGTMTPTTNITLVNNVHLQGQGNSTIISLNNGGLQIINKHDVYLSDFKMNGRKGIYFYASIKTSNLFCDNININCSATVSTDLYPFYFYADDGTMENIRLTNCRVLNSTTVGFFFNGVGTIDRYNNVLLDNCQAINCGRYNNINPWAVGFDLSEGNTYMENMTVRDCKASGSYESGFYFETTTIKKNVQLIGCVSEYNGQKTSPTYGAGYTISGGITLSDCISSHNSKKEGFDIFNDRDEIRIDNCYDYASKNGSYIHDGEGKVFIDGLYLSRNTQWGIRTFACANITAKNLFIDNPDGDAATFWCTWFGSSTYPLKNSSIEIFANGGSKDYLIVSQGGDNNVFSGRISTNVYCPMYLWNCTNTIVKNMVIDSCGTYGICMRGNATIMETFIKNSKPSDALTYGVYRYLSGSPVVDMSTVNVDSSGITNKFSTGIVFIGYNSTRLDSTFSIVDLFKTKWNLTSSNLLSWAPGWNSTRSALSTYGPSWNSTRTALSTYGPSWNSTRSSLSTNGPLWNTTKSVVLAKSATWNASASNLVSYGVGWNATKTRIDNNEVAWNTTGSFTNTLLPFAPNWNSTRTTLAAYSPNWNATRTLVLAKSNTWNVTATNLVNYGLLWNASKTNLVNYGLLWNQTRTLFNLYKTNWNATSTQVNTWQSAWNTSGTTYTAGVGLTLSGTRFSLNATVGTTSITQGS